MAPADKTSALVQGTLDMLILKTLALEPMHGYGIGMRLEQISRGAFQVNAGSLFPAFRRLERDGLIKAEWRATENNRRAKYYALTAAGRRRLSDATREWEAQTAAITRIMRATLGEA
jgi:PadR family transcriptional regulator, regulatory protein PadR